LQCGTKELQSEMEIVTAAVHQNGLALQWTTEGLRSNREIVMAAVKQNGMALK
jgi:hypothetical protein